MAERPPQEVVDAIENGNSSITRRLDIYESDGATLWLPGDSDESRLIDGNVNIDYNRDERRAIELSLSNNDNALRPDPDSGLWYDKVLKPYRGVRYATSILPPRVVIIEEDAVNQGYAFRSILSQLGFSRTDVKVNVTDYDELADYEIIVSYMRGEMTNKTDLLQQAYNAGKKVITVGSRNNYLTVPLFFVPETTGIDGIPDDIPFNIGGTGTYEVSTTYGIYQPSYDTPLSGGWTDETVGTYTGYRPTVVVSGVTVVAWDSTLTHPMAAIVENQNGGRWFHYQPKSFGTQGKNLLHNALDWLRNYQPYKNWEIQLGEFVIDAISEDNFPKVTSIQARDYTKKLLSSKMSQALTFSKGSPAVAAIQALAINAGITKFKLPVTTETLPSELAVERGTDRWAVMKTIAQTFNYEIFFDHTGALTIRKYIDPAFGALSQTFQTGSEGNLVQWSRSTNDSRIYNHIVITGERDSGESEVELLPYFGEAENKEPSSPTRVSRIGRRTYFYSSTFFTSDKQCRDLAISWLKIKSLESYDINWQSFNYPWMEVGEVAAFLDPDRAVHEPTRFLMDTLDVPMGLGPMSATAKRITYVNDPTSVPDDIDEEAA